MLRSSGCCGWGAPPAGHRPRPTALAATCDLLAWEAVLWLFLDEPDLAPTNNLSERRLRRPVLWRGGSFGSDSPTGSRFVERILSTVATLSAQQRSVLAFLMSAHVNHVAGLPAPSLLPPQTDPA